jgi:hypothetical protein
VGASCGRSATRALDELDIDLLVDRVFAADRPKR